MKKATLGRGLSALFGEGADGEDQRQQLSLRLSDVEPDPGQPRQRFDEQAMQSLAESIRQNGVITPIIVRRTGETYRIIAGERRWRASRLAELSEIPAIVLDVDETQAYGLTLIENLQREDLNPIEEAEGFHKLMQQFGLTQNEVSEKVGKSRPAVANALRLLALPGEVQADVRDGELSAGHARALAAVEDKKVLAAIAQKVKQEGLSVREAESLVKKAAKGAPKPQKPAKKDIYIAQLERDLSAAMGRKVVIFHGKRGKLTIDYYGNDDLDALCALLMKGKG